MSIDARRSIAENGIRFIEPGSTILIHGHSRVVVSILEHAASKVGKGV